MASELLLKFIGYFPDYFSAFLRTLLRFFWTTNSCIYVYIPGPSPYLPSLWLNNEGNTVVTVNSCLANSFLFETRLGFLVGFKVTKE